MSHTSPLCMRGLLITLTLFTSLQLSNVKEANTTQRRARRTILSSP